MDHPAAGCGVWNLHCPQVESAAHAAEIVAASRYAPRGLRGNAGHSPGTDYDMTGSAAERRAFANRQVFVTVMFETAAAFNDLDAIAAMDGIDALTIGPADLAQDLGVFGTPDQARVLDEKRDLVLAAAKKHGKTCAMLCSTQEQAQQWKAAGRAAAGIFQRQRSAAWGNERSDRQDQGIATWMAGIRWPRRLRVTAASETSARTHPPAWDYGRRWRFARPPDAAGNPHRRRI